MAKKEVAEQALDLQEDIEKVRQEALKQGKHGVAEILKTARRELDRAGEYNREEAPDH
jgi:hypothetical protein